MGFRRALRRLCWVLVKGGARVVGCACVWGIQRAVGVELAAERGIDRARWAPGYVPGMSWPPVSNPLPPPPAVPPPPAAQGARHPTLREIKLANFAGHEGCGLYVLDGELAAVIRNAGHC